MASGFWKCLPLPVGNRCVIGQWKKEEVVFAVRNVGTHTVWTRICGPASRQHSNLNKYIYIFKTVSQPIISTRIQIEITSGKEEEEEDYKVHNMRFIPKVQRS